MINEDVIEFLRESNNIEDVWDDLSLQQAIYAWNYVIGEDELTSGVILKTHKILMLHQNLLPNEKGYFRKRPVWIANREGANFKDVPDLISDWVKKANKGLTLKDGKDYFCQQMHVQYERIHPFIDSNGRTGRIFYNWQREKTGLPIEIIYEKEKVAYYRWFGKAEVIGSPDYISAIDKLVREL